MQLALPNAQNFPAIFSQRPCHDFVALDVVIELAEPKFESALWNVREFAPAMSMPEASIHEQSDLDGWKHKVWFAKDAYITTPAGDAIVAK